MSIYIMAVVVMLAALVGAAIAVLSMMALYSLKAVREDMRRLEDKVRKDIELDIKDIERAIENATKDFYTTLEALKKECERSLNDAVVDSKNSLQELNNAVGQIYREMESVSEKSNNYSDKRFQEMDGLVKNWVDKIYQDLESASDKCRSYSDSKCDKLEERLKPKV